MSLRAQVAKGQRITGAPPAPIENYWAWRVIDGDQEIARGEEETRVEAVAAANAIADTDQLSPWQDV